MGSFVVIRYLLVKEHEVYRKKDCKYGDYLFDARLAMTLRRLACSKGLRLDLRLLLVFSLSSFGTETCIRQNTSLTMTIDENSQSESTTAFGRAFTGAEGAPFKKVSIGPIAGLGNRERRRCESVNAQL